MVRVARKLVRGSQIFGIAAIALIAAILAAPLLAQDRGGSAPPAVSAVDRDISRRQAELDTIKAQLERGRARVKELQSEEGNYLSRLEQIEKNISVSGHYIKVVQEQIDTTERVLVVLGDSLVKAEENLQNARERMKRRLRNAYMTGEMGGINRLQMLLTAKNPTELVHRIRYFQDLSNYDRRLVESIHDGIVQVNDKRAAQEESREALIKLLDGKREEQQALVEEEASRRVVLEDIRSQKEVSAAVVAELEEAQRELDAIIQMLVVRRKKVEEEAERRAVINFENRRGKLIWPVIGEVTRRFGRVVHPVYKTVIMNEGIDIAAKKGAPVISVAPGSVARVSWMRSLGQFAIIDHGGGYFTLYSHFDVITVVEDQEVALGAEIGRVGETGTAGGPKLHFQIRQAAGALNPEEWLEKR
jgi:septal ring factor EnvC (AmiA/AmiB activator)